VADVTITRIGTNQQYSDGWDVAFGGKRARDKAPLKKAAPRKKSSLKKSAKRKK
jgi:hypothetical protein